MKEQIFSKKINLKNALIIIISLLLIAVIGYLDYATGPEIAFYIFYLIPITLTTWFIRSTSVGIFISVMCSGAWFLSDYFSGGFKVHSFLPLWNLAIGLFFFITITLLLYNLNRSHQHEKELARTDPLTGISNRRDFYEHAEYEISRKNRTKEPVTLVYIDIDNFKDMNDNYGHLTGDMLLKNIASIIKNNVRNTDYPARLGGDEFCILFVATDKDQSRVVIGKIFNKFNSFIASNKWPVTLSIGSVTFINQPSSVDEMIKLSDNAMYEAKKNGKNGIKYKIF